MYIPETGKPVAVQNMMPPEFAKTFSRHLKIYEVIGFHIFENPERSDLRKHLRLVFFGILFHAMTLSQLLFLWWGQDIYGADMLDIIVAIPCGVIFLLDLIKLYSLASKKAQLPDLLAEMAELWPRDLLGNVVKNYEMKSRTLRARMYDNIVLFGTAIALIVFHSMPIALTFMSWLNSECVFQTSHNMYFPWSINSLARYIVCEILIVTFAFPFYLSVGLNTELFLLALLNDLSVLFRLLHIDLENVTQLNEDETMDSDERHEKEIENLKYIIRTHQKLLRLSGQINKLFGLIIFATTSSSAVLICFFGFLVVVSEGTYVFIYFMGLFGMVTSILNISWPGQLLCDASSGLADAAYNCMWYKREPKFRKLILIIIHSSQKPCYLTALGMYSMTYQSLVKVFNTSLSYMSLLRQIYAQEQSI